MARAVIETLVLAVLVLVVMRSQKWGAIILILLGLAATAASFPLSADWLPVSAAMLRRAGDILAFSALIWVICSWPYYISPHSRCDRSLSEPRDDIRLGL